MISRLNRTLIVLLVQPASQARISAITSLLDGEPASLCTLLGVGSCLPAIGLQCFLNSWPLSPWILSRAQYSAWHALPRLPGGEPLSANITVSSIAPGNPSHWSKVVQGSHSPWYPLPRGQMLVASPQTTESGLFYLTSQCFLKMALVSTFKNQILCFKIPGYGGVSVNSKSPLPYVKSWQELSRDSHRHRAMVTCCPPCSPLPSGLSHVQLAHLIYI